MIQASRVLRAERDAALADAKERYLQARAVTELAMKWQEKAEKAELEIQWLREALLNARNHIDNGPLDDIEKEIIACANKALRESG